MLYTIKPHKLQGYLTEVQQIYHHCC